MSSHYRSYKAYLHEKYGATAYRVGIDAGFSCPNRRSRRTPGCTYCESSGARAVYAAKGKSDAEKKNPDLFQEQSCQQQPREIHIKEQTEKAISFLKKRYAAKHLLLYLQAFSNTYGDADSLQQCYDYCLSLAEYKELIVSTRPDCINDSIADLLASYKSESFDVWVELGLQSAHNSSLQRINRGHSVEDFVLAYTKLKERKIKVAVHLIFGLPGETKQEMLDSVRFLSALKPDAVKFHNLHIPIGTVLFQEFMSGELAVPSFDRHLEYCSEAIQYLPESTVILRLTTDTKRFMKAAPKGFPEKGVFIEAFRKKLRTEGIYQGSLHGSIKSD